MFRNWAGGALLIAALAISSAVSSHVAMAGTLDEIKARGKLIAGVKGDYKPFGYFETDGKHVGLDVDIARTFAKALFSDENKLELVPVTSAQRIPTLLSKKVDIIIASMTITDERKKQVDFSDPYFLSGSLMLAPKQSAIKNMSDLRGKTVGVIQGTIQVGDMEELAPTSERVRFDKVNEALFALKSGQTDAFAQDDILMLTLAHDNADLKTVGDPFKPRPFGIAVRKGETEFLSWVNEQMSALRSDGTYDQLWKKYFGDVEAKLMRLKSSPTAQQAQPALTRTQPAATVKQNKPAPKL